MSLFNKDGSHCPPGTGVLADQKKGGYSNMHDQIIRQLYHCILHDDGEIEKISRETREAVNQILKDNDCLANEKLHDAFYLAASAAEENGFVKGFICAFRLFSECSMK